MQHDYFQKKNVLTLLHPSVCVCVRVCVRACVRACVEYAFYGALCSVPFNLMCNVTIFGKIKIVYLLFV